MTEEEIVSQLKKLGATTGSWYEVSERPGKPPFAKELEYKLGDIMWGKIHLRLDGDLYVHIISKIPFNWKDRVKDLKIKGNIEDSAGGLLWIKTTKEDLYNDLSFIKDYLQKIKK
ncbi:succinate dehydrogenase [Acidianus manzaensis]|uniref:Succinate dehydrogenase n=1 Tax=Acidianus manzaensis TaxID=282676 RepID=A0A1W6JY06_9CREN|nr:succinate dehydrogenase [Acidianus manzaensis]ARM75156.1 succinate dehydrogenase [Acidianus manzaensis]